MITNIKKNIMGTVSFDGKFSKMNKSQKFIIYPINKKSNVIHIQSDTRFGQINIDSGEVIMSKSHSSHANFVSLHMDNLKGVSVRDTLSKEIFNSLKEKIKETSGYSVGNDVITCDNSMAGSI